MSFYCLAVTVTAFLDDFSPSVIVTSPAPSNAPVITAVPTFSFTANGVLTVTLSFTAKAGDTTGAFENLQL